jgi:malate dehydrogenase
MRKKITVIGAGHVGESTALMLAQKELGDVVLTDIIEDMPQGKSLDLMEMTPLAGVDSSLRGSNDLADMKGSDIVVMTAGLPRKPGMSRMDLLTKNAEIVGGVAEAIKKNAPNSIVVMVSNPLDVMSYLAYKVTGFDKRRVVGMAGVLDSTRLRAFVAMELNVSVADVHAMVLGGHGDSMVPLPRYTTVNGIPITEFLSKEVIDGLMQRTRMGGGEIVKLLKTGSAYYSPAAAAVQMVEAIVRDKKRILPAAALLQGEYGLSGVYVGVPVKLGAGGVEQVIELKLMPEELEELKKSAADVAQGIKDLGV